MVLFKVIFSFCFLLLSIYVNGEAIKDNFVMPPQSDYFPSRTHPCFQKYAAEPILFITSFNAKWYHHMLAMNEQSKIPWSNTPMKTTLNYPLLVYHEDDLPDLELNTTCKIDLRKEYSWLEYELTDERSGLNRYYNLSGFWDPCFIPRVGSTKVGHVLMLKVGAINHAIQSAATGQIVFWIDTDVSFREPLSLSVLNWLAARDITYIPFLLGKRQRLNLSLTGGTKEILKSDGRWRVETGLYALTANDRTRAFTKKALELYRGGMYQLAQRCFQKDPFCMKQDRIKYHVFLNDIFVYAILIHSDLHNDSSLFSVGLKHGVFAFAGFPAWGPERWVWGGKGFIPLFPPASEDNPNDIVTNFYIGKYIFHHFGSFAKGVLSLQLRVLGNNAFLNSTWRKITDPGKEYGSLHDITGVPYLG